MLLVEALLASSNAGATDPRDKIYALLGLTRDGTQLVPLPNYAQPVSDVFLEVTQKMVIQERLDSLILLARSCNSLSSQRDTSVPSWVPDYSMARIYPPWIHQAVLLPIENPSRSAQSSKDTRTLIISGLFLEAIGNVPKMSLDGTQADCTSTETQRPPRSRNADPARVFDLLQYRLRHSFHNFNDSVATDHSTLLKALTGANDIRLLVHLLQKLRISCSGLEPAFSEDSDVGTSKFYCNSITSLKSWYSLTMTLRYHGRSLSDWLSLYESRYLDDDGYGRVSKIPEKMIGLSPHGIYPIHGLWMVAMMGIVNHGMKIVVSSRDQFRVVHQKSLVHDVIYRLGDSPLPVVLRPAHRDVGATSRLQYSFVGEGCDRVRIQESDWAGVSGFSKDDFPTQGTEAHHTQQEGPKWEQIELI